VRWREGMERALYGPGGFFVAGGGPGAHFRTSGHASGLFAGAVGRVVTALDAALGRPERLDVVDVGAGRGELLVALLEQLEPSVSGRVRAVAVERAPRPPGLPDRIEWRDSLPESVTGLLIAVEWLDNVPLELVRSGRYLLTDGGLGEPVSAADAAWLSRWWPVSGDEEVAEVGSARDVAWSEAVSRVRRGLALAVDYGHLAGERPLLGTLTGYRAGRQVEPVADGSCDLTAHVAMDSLVETSGGVLLRQREALRRLGVTGARPPLSQASADPAGYLRALATAGQAAELTDPAGLGAHWWLLRTVGVPLADLGFGHDA
jgi:SAM-dependent MidA family methyltransferase